MYPSITSYQQRIEHVLDTSTFDICEDSVLLREAMRYSLLDGGKRIRALLVYAAGEALSIDVEKLDMPAAAIECIHAYSLIHDDLPSMDDDDLRRGKPTSHIKFGEATATLCGDALQALAFKLLSIEVDAVSPHENIKAMQSLSEAALKMVQGQMIDLAAVGERLNESELELMHQHKTGALIKSSIDMAIAYDGAYAENQISKYAALQQYALSIGLAFQVQDDILDVESDTETLGKTQGSDAASDKPTYTSIIGIQGSRKKVEKLYNKSFEALSIFGKEADFLRALADYIVKRKH